MKHWLYLVLLFCVCRSTAQYPTFHHYSAENGLPTDEVYCVAQDEKGFIWLGTDAGLFRFNGVYYQRFSCATQQSSSITGVVFDKEGTLYCYNFSNQIFAVKRDTMFELEAWKIVRGSGFPNITVNQKNQLFATSGNGFYWFQNESNSWKKLEGTEQSLRLWCDKQNIMWFTRSDGVYTYNGHLIKKNQIESLGKEKFNYGNIIISESSKGVVLFCITNGNVFRWQNNRFVIHPSKTLKLALQNRKITSVKFLQQKFFITTYSGVVLFDENKDEVKVWYPDEAFSSVMIDSEENVWLTTLRNGIYVLPQQDFIVWNKASNALPENRITDVVSFEDKLYFSMQNGSIGRLNTTDHSLKVISTEAKADIRNIFFDKQAKQLLFNSNNSLFAWNKNEITTISASVGPVKKIIELPTGYLVCTSLGAKFYKSFANQETVLKLTDSWCRDAIYDSLNHTLFIATNNGLLKTEFPSPKLQFDTLLQGAQVVALAASNHAIYALNFKGEVWQFFPNQIAKIFTIPSQCNVSDILVFNGKIFIASSAGLWKVDEKKHDWFLLNRTSGLCSNDIQAITTANNQLWLATAKGLQAIPINFVWNKPTPKFYLKLKAENKIYIASTNNVQLNYQQPIKLFPQAISYSSFGRFRFAYSLNGAGATWTYANADDSAIILNGIPAGKFLIEAKAIDFAGRSSTILKIKGEVLPPIWQRWWFYVLLMLSSMAVVYFLFSAYVRQLKKKQREKLQRIALENELKLAQQTALKAQMNPHFIFNVLTSVKSFIYENDKKSAAEYLGKFSDLMRGILHLSSLPQVRLSDELANLKLYIELEAMLLEPPFEFTIFMDENIDAHAIRIPALLLQPLVENAFKHGLRHKKGTKSLAIEIRHTEGFIEVIITDNGIGRAASAHINSQQQKTHQSFATEATAKRIALLNKERNHKIGLQYIDLLEGTKVVITIPVFHAAP